MTLTLSKVGSTEVIKEVVSVTGGSYTFENVLPGDYEIKASHKTLKFDTVSSDKLLSILCKAFWKIIH